MDYFKRFILRILFVLACFGIFYGCVKFEFKGNMSDDHWDTWTSLGWVFIPIFGIYFIYRSFKD